MEIASPISAPAAGGEVVIRLPRGAAACACHPLAETGLLNADNPVGCGLWLLWVKCTPWSAGTYGFIPGSRAVVLRVDSADMGVRIMSAGLW